MYTKTALVSALAGLAAAAPAPRSDNSNVFEAISLHSGSPVQGSTINANGNHFYINKAASTYCPSGVEGLDCSQYGTQTIFAFNPSSSGLALYAAVPGGQQIYVEATGALGYTIPHSGAIPNDAYVSPFEYIVQTSTGTVGKLTFEGKDFNACPTGETNGEVDIYQIFASAVSSDTQTGCIDIAIGTATDVAAPTAYEYS
ncbi:uncharacterized protein LY89DRAFT_108924 [Mollisia scopiformis]|uniref:Uncharacterized protein n=1 Tax=Mollisia scopiformis TaxID=149040 RepID=A0A194X5H3_MOLSC|nr:uncharacterized protein LY89DRAFT_108924 [Mollisia scopiformis]KUJ15324.1 hypothetical protein LY89DRAFT_108924 [Mollisia scopiformis]